MKFSDGQSLWASRESETMRRVHTDTSPSTGFSARVSKGLPYCKQCYVTWTLHYICHDNDVIIDVKTFWCPFLLFSWRKSAQKLLIFQGSFYLYKTCIIVNGCYWSICKLVFTLTLWRPLLPYVYGYLQHPVDRVKPSFVIFDIRAFWRSALSVRVAGCQKLQMTA